MAGVQTCKASAPLHHFFNGFFGKGGRSMSSIAYARIRNNPQFAQLVAARGRFAWFLSAIVFIVFFSFVLAVAFAPDFLAQRPFASSNITIGILAGLFQFISFWLLTLMYVRRANGEFDDLNKAIIDAASREDQ
jgi:uncharacterized membrane protein (DUF485 family)